MIVCKQYNNTESQHGDPDASMFSALKLFHDHAKHASWIFSASIGFVFAIATIAFKTEDNFIFRHMLLLIACIILFLTGYYFDKYIAEIVSRYFRLYVSSAVYSARVYRKCDCVEHPWLVDLVEISGEDIDSKAIVDSYIHNYKVLYAELFRSLSIVCMILGGIGIIFFCLFIWCHISNISIDHFLNMFID